MGSAGIHVALQPRIQSRPATFGGELSKLRDLEGVCAGDAIAREPC